MIKKEIKDNSRLSINNSIEGESIEDKIERILSNGEPITDTAPIIYTPRNEGVKPEYDIRTDRFELAVEAMGHVSKSQIAKRVSMTGEKKEEGSGEPSTQATDNK